MSEWRQFRIDSTDIVPKSDDDCFISEDDPMWQYVGVGKIKTAVPQITPKFDNTGNEKSQYMRDHDIRPGSKEGFKLWFGKNN